MAPLRELSSTLLAPARGLGIVGWTSTMLAAVEGHKLLDRTLGPGARQEAIFDGYMRTWTAGLLALFGVEFRVLGVLPPPATTGRLVVANHRTVLDIGALLSHFGGSVLSRGDLEQWPLLGVAAQKAQTIFVDRESKHSGATAIRAIRAQLGRGRTVSVFPEGTTFSGDEVRPFIAGAFVACRKLDVEIVPVGFAYPPDIEWDGETFVEHLQITGARPRTRAVMAVGAPFRSDARAAELAVRCHGEVQTLVDRARRALDADQSPA